jgi:hypothetical protein
VAACVREIMAERSSWTGSAADLLQAGAALAGDGVLSRGSGWPQNPRALAGRLRRVQTPLRAIGIEIGFSREGRSGNRIIRIHANLTDTVSTVSYECDDRPPPQPADDVCDNNYRPNLVRPCPMG